MGTSLEAKVGLFTTITLIILICGILWLNGHQLFDRSYQLEVEFSHVGGLRPGAPVQMSGVDIGRVASVTLNADGKVLVVLNLKPEVTLKADALVMINTAGLLGEKMIEIYPGQGKGVITPGARLQGREPFSTEQLLRETGETLSALNRITIALDRFLSDGDILTKIEQTVTDLERITGNLAQSTATLNTADFGAVVANLQTITNGLASIKYEEVNTILGAGSKIPDLLQQLEEFVAGFTPFQTELNHFLAELRAEGQTADTITNILQALELTAANLEILSTQLAEGEPNLADLLTATQVTLESIQVITAGINRLMAETAVEGSTDLFKSSMEKAGRVLNLADDFLETYDHLSFRNQFALSVTPEDWGIDYQAKLAWGTEQFLLFGCNDLGDRNQLSLQFGIGHQPWQFRFGILHDWLGFGLDYYYRNLNLQADLWQPNEPVLDLYAQYRLNPLLFSVGLRNLSTPAQQWEFGVGWNF